MIRPSTHTCIWPMHNFNFKVIALLAVCTSYTTAWKYLISEAHYLDRIKSGHWIWVYDNLNLCQGIRNECDGIIVHIFNQITCIHHLKNPMRLPLIHDECDVKVGCEQFITSQTLNSVSQTKVLSGHETRSQSKTLCRVKLIPDWTCIPVHDEISGRGL